MPCFEAVSFRQLPKGTVPVIWPLFQRIMKKKNLRVRTLQHYPQLTSFPFTRQLTFPLLDMMSAHDLLDLNYQ